MQVIFVHLSVAFSMAGGDVTEGKAPAYQINVMMVKCLLFT